MVTIPGRRAGHALVYAPLAPGLVPWGSLGGCSHPLSRAVGWLHPPSSDHGTAPARDSCCAAVIVAVFPVMLASTSVNHSHAALRSECETVLSHSRRGPGWPILVPGRGASRSGWFCAVIMLSETPSGSRDYGNEPVRTPPVGSV